MPEILIINTLHHLSLSLEVCCVCLWKKTIRTSCYLSLFYQQLVWLFHPSRYSVRVVLHRSVLSPLRVSICSAAENARNPRAVQRDQFQPERLSRLLLQAGRGECQFLSWLPISSHSVRFYLLRHLLSAFYSPQPPAELRLLCKFPQMTQLNGLFLYQRSFRQSCRDWCFLKWRLRKKIFLFVIWEKLSFSKMRTRNTVISSTLTVRAPQV